MLGLMMDSRSVPSRTDRFSFSGQGFPYEVELTLPHHVHPPRQGIEQSGSFLYGLRRDTPSTERVLLERLLNILSRAAAANKSRNPQRLWAQSERPEWWTQVTDLPWKNPREHPKDNKETLKKKIEVLKTELRKRDIMTKELEEELEIHRGSKKIDLELKSDFEAVISKASGLHYMLDKVSSKMGQSRIISDKMATYIKETKHCLDRVHKRINTMYDQVQAREDRKSDLWTTMGVSKHQQPLARDDLVLDSLGMEPDLEMMGDLPDELAGFFSSKLPAFLPYPAEILPSQSSDFSDAVPPQSPSSMPAESSPEDFFISDSYRETSETDKPEQVLWARDRRSVSQPSSTLIEAKTAQAVDVSQRRSVSLTLPSSSMTKRGWRQLVDASEEFEHEQTRVKSPRFGMDEAMVSASEGVIVIDDDENSGSRSEAYIRDTAFVTYNPMLTSPVLHIESGKGRRHKAEVETTQIGLVSKQQRSAHSQMKSTSSASRYKSSLPGFQSKKHSAFPDVLLSSASTVTRGGSSGITPHRQKTDPLIGGGTSTITSTPKAKAGMFQSDMLPSDVFEDVGDVMLEDMSDVGEMLTVSMYAKDTSGMDHLASMTSALSCEDLKPSVTETVMTGQLPSPKTVRSLGFDTAVKTPWTYTITATGLERQPQKPATVGLPRPQTSVTREIVRDSPTEYLLMPASPQLTVRRRGVSRKDDNGGKSLSKAIGNLSGDLFS
ncbi:hypothetical protein ACOMHN_043903 [Nucella lapillus]